MSPSPPTRAAEFVRLRRAGLRSLFLPFLFLGLVACGASSGSGDPSCVAENDAAFCSAAGKNCGSLSGNDNCGVARTASCGSCTSGQSCGGGGVPNVCSATSGGGCVAETDAAFCSGQGMNCGVASGPDNCGNPRTANCGSSCPSGESCGSEAPNVCGPAGGTCVSESDAVFCAGLGKDCGSVSGTDNCGAARTASCGSSCPSGETCGGGGTLNVCGSTGAACVPESDATFCAGLGTDCGSVSGTDNCGAARTANCGSSCPSGETCGGGGPPNVCAACVPESDAALCAADGKNCGTFSGTDNCGATRSADCGTCSSGTCGATNVCVVPKESWVAVYIDYPTALADITANAQSFTHVVPTFYTVNYNYQSGVAYYSTCPTDGKGDDICVGNSANAFPDLTLSTVLTTEEFTANVPAGIRTVPIIFGGAANNGTDVGIENILAPGTTQENFITAMASEAVTNGYAGYNIDWEVASVGSSYASLFVAFLNNFKAKLVSAGIPNPILSISAIVSNINGTNCSGGNGYIDFSLLQGSSVDRIVIEDFLPNLTNASSAPTTCQSVVLNDSSPAPCDYSFTGLLNMMCAPNLGSTAALDFDKAVIGLEADPYGTNPIIGSAFSTLESYGFTKVAIWPQYQSTSDPFMSNAKNSPVSDTWYGLLAAFLAQ